MKDTFEFHKNFRTGEITAEPVGRIHLASGEACRIFFTPTGIKLLLPELCLKNGDIKTYKSSERFDGLSLGQAT